MCGIAGVFSRKGKALDLDLARAMSDLIKHRGPDGSGSWISESENVVLLHRRLSIIDLSSAAAQPMLSDDDNLSIVFNGEIYNYIEVREVLKGNGYFFKTDSDTEVILKAYHFWGENCLPHFDGMFAMAIWDNINQSLFCARDRFGEKPFYYYLSDDEFIFSSEIKSIIAYKKEVTINKDFVQSYLFDENVLTQDKTFFNDIHVLEQASWVKISTNEVLQNHYWSIDINSKNGDLNEEQCILEFGKLLRESISFRLRSDVPVGSSLSGGMDSSTIVCMLSDMGISNMQTFSARFNSALDEGKWIDDVSFKTGFKNHPIWPDPIQFGNELEQIIWHHEFPVRSASVYAQWCVMKLPRESNVKVLLDGQGADEYLAGYDELKYFAIWDLYKSFKLSSFFDERKLFKKFYGGDKSLGFSFLADPLLSKLGMKRSIFRNGESLKEVLKFYTTTKLSELLRYADRNSMAHSVEVRLPFLYHKLVEFVFSINPDFIYKNGKTKYILRESAKNILPETIYNRTDKIGFAPPQNDWMNTPEMKSKLALANSSLLDFGFKPSNNQFRNFSTCTFLKRFN